jgi:hypothetical protein
MCSLAEYLLFSDAGYRNDNAWAKGVKMMNLEGRGGKMKVKTTLISFEVRSGSS